MATRVLTNPNCHRMNEMNINHILSSYGIIGQSARISNIPNYTVVSNVRNTAGIPISFDPQVNVQAVNAVALGVGQVQQENEVRVAEAFHDEGAVQLQPKETATSSQPAHRSYLDAVESNAQAIPVKNISPPTLEGGNIVITLDEDEIEAEEKECVYDVIGRISYLKGEKPLPTLELLKKLSAIWDVEVRDLSYIGNGCYHVFLKNYIWQTNILSRGTVSLKPGMFRVQRWMTNFDPWSFKQKHDQVWMRIYGLPMEYRGKLSLFRIAHGAGTPLRIDENTQRRGQYSRVLVDYDCSRKPPEELLVKREKMGINFFVPVYLESLPKFCFHCNMLGHSDDICRKKHGGKANEPSRRPAEDRGSQENARRMYVEKRKNMNNAGQEASTNKNASGGEEEVDNSTEDIRDRGVEEEREQETGNFRPRINWAVLVEEESDESAERVEFGVQHDVAMGGNTMVMTEKEGASTAGHNAVTAGGYGEEEGTGFAERHSSLQSVEATTPSRVDETQQGEEGFTLVLSRTAQKEKNKQRKEAEEIHHSGGKLMENETRSVSASSNTWGRTRWGDIDLDAIDNRHRFTAYEEEPDLPPPPSGMKIGSPISSALKKKLQKKSTCYDDDMVYWERDMELHVHKSGMCFDYKNKIYVKPIDYKKGDLRPLYYRESSGDFTLAVTGVPGQSNKRLLQIKDWNRDAIYNVKSSDYKPGLINLFKDSLVRFVRGEEQPIVLTPSSEM